jgi:hypothetical protein
MNCVLLSFSAIFNNKVLENLIELNLNYLMRIESKDLKVIGDNCCFLKRLNMSNLIVRNDGEKDSNFIKIIFSRLI